jgi:hypothetical protein
MRALTILSTAAVVVAFAVSLFYSDAAMAGWLGLLLGVRLMGHAVDYRASCSEHRSSSTTWSSSWWPIVSGA